MGVSNRLRGPDVWSKPSELWKKRRPQRHGNYLSPFPGFPRQLSVWPCSLWFRAATPPRSLPEGWGTTQLISLARARLLCLNAEANKSKLAKLVRGGELARGCLRWATLCYGHEGYSTCVCNSSKRLSLMEKRSRGGESGCDRGKIDEVAPQRVQKQLWAGHENYERILESSELKLCNLFWPQLEIWLKYLKGTKQLKTWIYEGFKALENMLLRV